MLQGRSRKENSECQTDLQCTPFILKENETARVQSCRLCQTEIQFSPRVPDDDIYKILEYIDEDDIEKDAVQIINLAQEPIKIKYLLPKIESKTSTYIIDEGLDGGVRYLTENENESYQQQRQKEEESVQTDLMISPHILNDKENAIISLDASCQTSLTCTPKTSITQVVPKLTSYWVHSGMSRETVNKTENVLEILRQIIQDVIDIHQHMFDPNFEPIVMKSNLVNIESKSSFENNSEWDTASPSSSSKKQINNFSTNKTDDLSHLSIKSEHTKGSEEPQILYVDSRYGKNESPISSMTTVSELITLQSSDVTLSITQDDDVLSKPSSSITDRVNKSFPTPVNDISEKQSVTATECSLVTKSEHSVTFNLEPSIITRSGFMTTKTTNDNTTTSTSEPVTEIPSDWSETASEKDLDDTIEEINTNILSNISGKCSFLDTNCVCSGIKIKIYLKDKYGDESGESSQKFIELNIKPGIEDVEIHKLMNISTDSEMPKVYSSIPFQEIEKRMNVQAAMFDNNEDISKLLRSDEDTQDISKSIISKTDNGLKLMLNVNKDTFLKPQTPSEELIQSIMFSNTVENQITSHVKVSDIELTLTTSENFTREMLCKCTKTENADQQPRVSEDLAQYSSILDHRLYSDSDKMTGFDIEEYLRAETQWHLFDSEFEKSATSLEKAVRDNQVEDDVEVDEYVFTSNLDMYRENPSSYPTYDKNLYEELAVFDIQKNDRTYIVSSDGHKYEQSIGISFFENVENFRTLGSHEISPTEVDNQNLDENNDEFIQQGLSVHDKITTNSADIISTNKSDIAFGGRIYLTASKLSFQANNSFEESLDSIIPAGLGCVCLSKSENDEKECSNCFQTIGNDCVKFHDITGICCEKSFSYSEFTDSTENIGHKVETKHAKSYTEKHDITDSIQEVDTKENADTKETFESKRTFIAVEDTNSSGKKICTLRKTMIARNIQSPAEKCYPGKAMPAEMCYPGKVKSAENVATIVDCTKTENILSKRKYGEFLEEAPITFGGSESNLVIKDKCHEDCFPNTSWPKFSSYVPPEVVKIYGNQQISISKEDSSSDTLYACGICSVENENGKLRTESLKKINKSQNKNKCLCRSKKSKTILKEKKSNQDLQQTTTSGVIHRNTCAFLKEDDVGNKFLPNCNSINEELKRLDLRDDSCEMMKSSLNKCTCTKSLKYKKTKYILPPKSKNLDCKCTLKQNKNNNVSLINQENIPNKIEYTNSKTDKSQQTTSKLLSDVKQALNEIPKTKDWTPKEISNHNPLKPPCNSFAAKCKCIKCICIDPLNCSTINTTCTKCAENPECTDSSFYDKLTLQKTTVVPNKTEETKVKEVRIIDPSKNNSFPSAELNTLNEQDEVYLYSSFNQIEYMESYLDGLQNNQEHNRVTFKSDVESEQSNLVTTISEANRNANDDSINSAFSTQTVLTKPMTGKKRVDIVKLDEKYSVFSMGVPKNLPSSPSQTTLYFLTKPVASPDPSMPAPYFLIEKTDSNSSRDKLMRLNYFGKIVHDGNRYILEETIPSITNARTESDEIFVNLIATQNLPNMNCQNTCSCGSIVRNQVQQTDNDDSPASMNTTKDKSTSTEVDENCSRQTNQNNDQIPDCLKTNTIAVMSQVIPYSEKDTGFGTLEIVPEVTRLFTRKKINLIDKVIPNAKQKLGKYITLIDVLNFNVSNSITSQSTISSMERFIDTANMATQTSAVPSRTELFKSSRQNNIDAETSTSNLDIEMSDNISLRLSKFYLCQSLSTSDAGTSTTNLILQKDLCVRTVQPTFKILSSTTSLQKVTLPSPVSRNSEDNDFTSKLQTEKSSFISGKSLQCSFQDVYISLLEKLDLNKSSSESISTSNKKVISSNATLPKAVSPCPIQSNSKLRKYDLNKQNEINPIPKKLITQSHKLDSKHCLKQRTPTMNLKQHEDIFASVSVTKNNPKLTCKVVSQMSSIDLFKQRSNISANFKTNDTVIKQVELLSNSNPPNQYPQGLYSTNNLINVQDGPSISKVDDAYASILKKDIHTSSLNRNKEGSPQLPVPNMNSSYQQDAYDSYLKRNKKISSKIPVSKTALCNQYTYRDVLAQNIKTNDAYTAYLKQKQALSPKIPISKTDTSKELRRDNIRLNCNNVYGSYVNSKELTIPNISALNTNLDYQQTSRDLLAEQFRAQDAYSAYLKGKQIISSKIPILKKELDNQYTFTDMQSDNFTYSRKGTSSFFNNVENEKTSYRNRKSDNINLKNSQLSPLSSILKKNIIFQNKTPRPVTYSDLRSHKHIFKKEESSDSNSCFKLKKDLSYAGGSIKDKNKYVYNVKEELDLKRKKGAHHMDLYSKKNSPYFDKFTNFNVDVNSYLSISKKDKSRYKKKLPNQTPILKSDKFYNLNFDYSKYLTGKEENMEKRTFTKMKNLQHPTKSTSIKSEELVINPANKSVTPRQQHPATSKLSSFVRYGKTDAILGNISGSPNSLVSTIGCILPDVTESNQVLETVQSCEKRLQPIKNALKDIKLKLRELHMPEVNNIFEKDDHLSTNNKTCIFLPTPPPQFSNNPCSYKTKMTFKLKEPINPLKVTSNINQNSISHKYILNADERKAYHQPISDYKSPSSGSRYIHDVSYSGSYTRKLDLEDTVLHLPQNQKQRYHHHPRSNYSYNAPYRERDQVRSNIENEDYSSVDTEEVEELQYLPDTYRSYYNEPRSETRLLHNYVLLPPNSNPSQIAETSRPTSRVLDMEDTEMPRNYTDRVDESKSFFFV